MNGGSTFYARETHLSQTSKTRASDRQATNFFVKKQNTDGHLGHRIFHLSPFGKLQIHKPQQQKQKSFLVVVQDSTRDGVLATGIR
jgi:hypothetical protein